MKVKGERTCVENVTKKLMTKKGKRRKISVGEKNKNQKLCLAKIMIKIKV